MLMWFCGESFLIEINAVDIKVHFLGSNKYPEDSQGNGHYSG